jgi:hypothetical protein
MLQDHGRFQLPINIVEDMQFLHHMNGEPYKVSDWNKFVGYVCQFLDQDKWKVEVNVKVCGIEIAMIWWQA